MLNHDGWNALGKISNKVTEVSRRLWENEAHHIYYSQEIDRVKGEILRLTKCIHEEEKEITTLNEEVVEVSETLKTQQDTLEVSEKSQEILKSAEESLRNEIERLKKNYETTFQAYNDELEDCRLKYESTSDCFKELRQEKVELKKLKITAMDLEIKIKKSKEIKKQLIDIQKLISSKVITNFAKHCLLYQKVEVIQSLVKRRKEEEQSLMKQSFKLQQEVNQAEGIGNLSKFATHEDKIQISNKEKLASDLKNILNEDKSKFIPQIESDMLLLNEFDNFVVNDVESLAICSPETVEKSQHSVRSYNEDRSKVRILDVQIVKNFPNEVKAVNSSKKDHEKFIHEKTNVPQSSFSQDISNTRNNNLLDQLQDNSAEEYNNSDLLQLDSPIKIQLAINSRQQKSEEQIQPASIFNFGKEKSFGCQLERNSPKECSNIDFIQTDSSVKTEPPINSIRRKREEKHQSDLFTKFDDEKSLCPKNSFKTKNLCTQETKVVSKFFNRNSQKSVTFANEVISRQQEAEIEDRNKKTSQSFNLDKHETDTSCTPVSIAKDSTHERSFSLKQDKVAFGSPKFLNFSIQEETVRHSEANFGRNDYLYNMDITQEEKDITFGSAEPHFGNISPPTDDQNDDMATSQFGGNPFSFGSAGRSNFFNMF